MQYHPDKNPADKFAKEKFKQINMVYRIIAALNVENATANTARAETAHKSGRKTFQDFIDYINALIADLISAVLQNVR